MKPHTWPRTTSSDGGDHDLLTTSEAARFLRLSAQTMERLRVTGDGPAFIKLGPGRGARVVYRRSDLDAWLHAQRRDSTSDTGRHE